MLLDRSGTDDEYLSDCGVGRANSDEVEYVALAARERRAGYRPGQCQFAGLEMRAQEIGEQQILVREVMPRAVERDSDQAAGRPGETERELVLDPQRSEEFVVEPEPVHGSQADG